MTETQLKWTRRKQERPAEILGAAMDEFVEKGFAATRLSDVARRAGVVKGTLYRYYDTKEQLFEAVVQQALQANLGAVAQAGAAPDAGLAELIEMLLARAAGSLGDSRIPAIMRMVVAESRAFPALARIWHDEVIARVMATLCALIERARERGDIPAEIEIERPQILVMSIIGPMVAGMLFREVFGKHSPYAPDLQQLARLHTQLILRGLGLEQSPPA
jgi:AcrR family transcriptional regulator